MKINPDVIAKIKAIVEENPFYYQERTGNDAKYAEFLQRFPKEHIQQLTIDEYCLGDSVNFPNNFCWWIEKNLSETLGRYSLGNASGHMLYKRKADGEVQKIKALEDLSDEAAMVQVARLHHQIINSDPYDVALLDDNTRLAENAGLERFIVMGDSRKLRLLNLYYPDHFPIINSSPHIEQILRFLGAPEEEIPRESAVIARAELLRRYYLAIIDEIGIFISPYHFARLFYYEEEQLQFSIKKGEECSLQEENMILSDSNKKNMPLNQIFYGPPGTGKTYHSVERAVRIADPVWYQNWRDEGGARAILKVHYDELVERKQIGFITFHQSFSYEEFIEGIRAEVDEESKELTYKVDDGIFKRLVEIANQKNLVSSSEGIADLSGRKVWKMSLGNTQNEERYIYDECIENNYVALGYGGSIDFSGFDNRASLREKYSQVTGEGYDGYTFKVNAVDTFKNKMKTGDIVIISDGNHKFRAIGEITGEYEFLEIEERSNYRQIRAVKWRRVFDKSLPVELIINKNFSQMTLYRLGDSIIKQENLKEYLTPQANADETIKKNYVLIIDEINRGNIASIFGELITLIEPDKRAGASDAQATILPYSKEEFSVPNNLYLIGTMNTSDHSLTSIDIALRRRFEFIEMMPDYSLLTGTYVYGIDVAKLLKVINQRIEVLLGRDFVVGHSYFIPLKALEDKEKERRLGVIFKHQIIPLLQEYFYEDWERIQWVLNDQNKLDPADQFIQLFGKESTSLASIFPTALINEASLIDRRYAINEAAFERDNAYRQILIESN